MIRAILSLIRKGVRQLMAMLLAVNIVDGKFTYKRVPKFLKEQVKEQLILLGAEELITE